MRWPRMRIRVLMVYVVVIAVVVTGIREWVYGDWGHLTRTYSEIAQVNREAARVFERVGDASNARFYRKKADEFALLASARPLDPLGVLCLVGSVIGLLVGSFFFGQFAGKGLVYLLTGKVPSVDRSRPSIQPDPPAPK
jgi:membrane protein YqaA with SNARE-associated domain